MHISKPVLIVAFCLATLTSVLSLAATDKITLATDKSYEGNFTAYKNTRFYFTPTEGKPLHEMRVQVKSIEIDPPVKVSLKQRGKKDIEGIMFMGYKESKFLFEQAGKEVEIAAAQVTTIDVGMDFRRLSGDQGKEENMAQPEDAKPAEPVDLEASVKKGVMTIIHIHVKTDGPNPALRMENYVSGLPGRYKGKLVVAKHDLSGWNDPTAVKYEIKSTPQFWFYNKKGVQVKKLVERFTETDIDSALKTMSK